MSNKYKHGKYRISIADDKNIQNKVVSITDDEGNDVLSGGSIDISGKADKVSNATNGNFAGLDASGNLTDSGKKASDFATDTQGAKADTAYQKPQAGIPESDLSSDVQQALQKHFKGWYSTLAELKAAHTAVEGDAAYVKDASPATTWSIYIYDATATTDNNWADSGTDADTSNVQTFATGEEVNETYIDDTHLVNPADGALPTAADVMQLKAKLEGVTESEMKATYIAISSYKVQGNGNISSNDNAKYTTIALNGANKVRFIALNLLNTDSSATKNTGYCFGHYNGEEIEDNWVIDAAFKYDATSTSNRELVEIVKEVPQDSTHFRTNVKYSTELTESSFYCYLQSGESVGEIVKPIIRIVNDCEKVHNNLQFGYNPTGESISPTNEFSGLIIYGSNGNIKTGNEYQKVYCYPTSSENRYVYVDLYVKASATQVGGVWLIDNISTIVDGDSIPLSDKLNNPNNTYADKPKNVNMPFFVPAGRILVVTYSTYNSNSYINVYETEFSSKVIDDIQDDITELQDNIDTTVINTINGTLSVDAIPSSTNPLALIKETPGYTSIFRKIGVIGGSMSTGWHSNNTGSVSANMPEYSYLQFMARICSAEGHNFSRGGISARSWPQNDMMEDFYDTNKKCQMYIVQLGNNDLVYHSDHPEYTLGTIADLTPTGGTSISDYTYNTDTFYGNMARIINEVRKVQPRAYLFLSTFLKGYGSNSEGLPGGAFDYNGAIRNIVEYYTANDGANQPEGDELHYYLIDIYEYGQPYSFYSTGIHTGTVIGSHLVATGYNYWAYEFCTYIDWIIKSNMSDFNDVAFVGTDNYNL